MFGVPGTLCLCESRVQRERHPPHTLWIKALSTCSLLDLSRSPASNTDFGPSCGKSRSLPGRCTRYALC
jgi:hypothetical protein